jgi:hypothetical protein
MVEIFFIKKSIEKFRELKQAYIEYKKSKKELYNLLKEKEG